MVALLNEIESLKRRLHREASRYGNLTHSRVVRLSQQLDRKLNEYERTKRSWGPSTGE